MGEKKKNSLICPRIPSHTHSQAPRAKAKANFCDKRAEPNLLELCRTQQKSAKLKPIKDCAFPNPIARIYICDFQV